LVAILLVLLTFPLARPITPASAADPCSSLTPAAIQGAIDLIELSRRAAQQDEVANGTDGAYASAARDNLAYVTQAKTTMVRLRNWLHTNGFESPYVTNPTAAYNVEAYAREASISLQSARHWAMISRVHHGSVPAQTSFERSSQALSRLAMLGTQGGRCYMNAYPLS
jgi:hypothetical protein